MYKVLLHKKAIKYYKSLNDKTARKINKAIEKIRENPLEGFHIKKLKGSLEGKYRYKIEALRIIYIVNLKEKNVFIEAIGPRGDVYK
ncbi:MAG: type II toxin-antitoxin system RelE/ParE family toxin [bacterium]